MSKLHLRIPLTWMTLCLAAIAATVSLPSPSTASAVTGQYQHAGATYTFGADWGYAGDYVACPAGTRAVSSGAASTGYLMAGLTTFDGTAGYHRAYGGNGGSLQVSVQCVDLARVTGSTLRTTTFRDSRGGWRYYSKKVACPYGTLAYGGGGFVTSTGGSLSDAAFTYGSMPEGNGWRYAAAGDLFGGNLHVSTHCLPRARLGRVLTVTETGTYSGGPQPDLFVSARCPAGYFAFAGGAWLHSTGSATPKWHGHLKISQMAADDRGWTAFGRLFGPAQLSTQVWCTDRLG